MALRTILTEQDPSLHKKCRPVTEFNRRLWDLIDDLKETLAEANGAGLAAPQVGILRRVVIVVGEDEEMIELVNPEIVASEGEMINAEGCLSVPGRRGTVKRPERVTVRAQDRKGRPIEVKGEGFLTVALCHELDHLDGVLYVDKMIEDVTDREEDV